MEKSQEVAEMAEKVMKKLKEKVEKEGLKLSVTENGVDRYTSHETFSRHI